MAISTSSGNRNLFWQINITPLTDIFLVPMSPLFDGLTQGPGAD